MTFDEAMTFISSFSKSGKPITDLSRARELVERIGNPELSLKFVHVAGTNGKGSTVEYISNALIYSGYKVGQFTSPYVTHYTDRIRINGVEIDKKTLCVIADFVKERIADREYSQFEINMSIALLWFEMEKCDVVVLEAGIGGLLDSTNVIQSPLLTVITSISLDHTAVLGDTVEKIAEQKAGIIKENAITILSPNNEKSVSQIVREKAEKEQSTFVQPSESQIKINSILPMLRFSYKQKEYRVSMPGECQVYNAVVAIEACKWLNNTWGYNISNENITKSLETSRIKARMQYIYGSPTVIVDGGHNPAAVEYLCNNLLCEKKNGKKIYTVTGVFETKDYRHNMKHIASVSEIVYCVDDFAINAVNAKKLAETAGEYTEATACRTLSEAVEKAKNHALENDGIVVVSGSLYLASEYLRNYEK